jgi:3'-phosphoadenosine 5'-phosphosulfate (PAPS) 3'-phosphatase
MNDLKLLVERVVAACREVGREEVMPRYLKVAHQRKVDGSLLTEADLAAQVALFKRLQAIAPFPVLGEEMTEAEQRDVWGHGRRWFLVRRSDRRHQQFCQRPAVLRHFRRPGTRRQKCPRCGV